MSLSTSPGGADRPRAVTRTQLAADLRRLGLRPGAIAMVHTRMSALGWVAGGSEVVVRFLLDALGPDGTLMAYGGWQEHVFGPADWPEEHRAAYVAEPPVFDPATGEAARELGRIPERIRTWPGARRSVHPEASVVALGPRARWLTADHPQDDAYGEGTPFARLVDAGIDTSQSAYPFEALELGGVDGFEVIARDALAAGIGARGRVGQAECHVFDARELTRFAVAWIEARFGG